MKITFAETALEELYKEGKTKDRKYKYLCKDKKLLAGFRRVVSVMYNVTSTGELSQFSFLHYEKLKYKQYQGLSSVRLANGKIERLIFRETDNGIEITLIEIDNTHYGNKK